MSTDSVPGRAGEAAAARQSWVGPLAGAAIGAAFLIWLAGPRPLDPTEIGWAMRADWAAHYFGWHYFRTEPWHWPPGVIHGYNAPFGASIGLTDSIPLAAYLLKPVAAWLPTPFQYLGAWWLLCFTLQGALAARLLGRWLPGAAAQAWGAALFVLLPVLLARVAHAALCSHWLILWALLVASRPLGRRLLLPEWAGLGLVAGLVHPYLAAMTLGLLGATALAAAPAAIGRRAAAFGASVATTLVGWWLSGLFVLTERGALSAAGLGEFSMNLLAFVSPAGWSRVLPAVPNAGVGQEAEGFHYLGLGVLGLVVVAIALRIRRRGSAPLWPPAVVGAALLMAAFAISPRVTAGSAVVIDLTGPWTAPLAVFRASGRFAWPIAYLLLAWAIVTVARQLSPRAGTWAVAAAVAVQFADLQHIYLDRRQATHDPAFYAWAQPFTSPAWTAIASHYQHLVWSPPPQCQYPPPLPLPSVMRFAADHGLTLNSGVVSRHEEQARARYCETLDADVAAARLDDASLYLVPADRAAAIRAAGAGAVVCGAIDGATICTTAAAYARWRDVARLD